MVVTGRKMESRDIVDGHRQKTLQLLWTLIFVFKVIAVNLWWAMVISASHWWTRPVSAIQWQVGHLSQSREIHLKLWMCVTSLLWQSTLVTALSVLYDHINIRFWNILNKHICCIVRSWCYKNVLIIIRIIIINLWHLLADKKECSCAQTLKMY